MQEIAKPRILYMEDHYQQARLVQSKLHQLGYLVDLARDGTEGMSLLEKQKYDLVLLDPHIPMQGGLNLMQVATARESAPPILIVEEQHNAQTAALAIKLGVSDYLFQGGLEEHMQLLPMVIQRTLQKHQQQQELATRLEELRQDNRNLSLLTRAAQLLTSSLDMNQVISRMVQTITEMVITEGSSVWLWDEQQIGYLICTAMYLDDRDITSPMLRLPADQGIVGWVARHRQVVNILDAPSDPRFASSIDKQTGYSTRSILAVPLVTRNQVIGVLEFVNKLEGHFNDHDCELAETLAAYAANAIENARLMKSVSHQRDMLEAQNQALDAFAHSVAHDLKNPLTLIVGFADMLRDDMSAIPGEVVKQSLDTIVEYGIKMSNIVDALLLLATVGAGNEMETEPIDMVAIATAVLRRMEHTIREYQAEVTMPKEWPVAQGYGPWLEEVWYNYLSNAVKYGGRPPRIELGFDRCDNGFVRFWVKDNGIGAVLEHPKSLFTPQARGKRERNQTGHGLGLSIVARIIERLGGEVGAESRLHEGSTFYFTLPAFAKDANKA
jgi:signal transduction histidine kinase/DNA-binding response OmpR family regulator